MLGISKVVRGTFVRLRMERTWPIHNLIPVKEGEKKKGKKRRKKERKRSSPRPNNFKLMKPFNFTRARNYISAQIIEYCKNAF